MYDQVLKGLEEDPAQYVLFGKKGAMILDRQDWPLAGRNIRHPKKSERPRAPSFLPPKKTGAARGGPSRKNVFQNIPTANGEPLQSGDYKLWLQPK